MRFHLVYNGPLRASANKAKPADVLKVRQALDPQLRHLWKTHNALQVLEREGAVNRSGATIRMPSYTGPGSAGPREIALAMPQLYEDLCGGIGVGDKVYRPLVRSSLHLSCELEILFLRQADPGALVSQGGDLDNRIKLLLDALRMPDKAEQDNCPPPESELYCLMESDHLVSRLDVNTDRLLFPQTDKPDEVHLVIEVTINVLRVATHNMCLL